MKHLLLAVDDSPAGLAAARVAVELAAGWPARLRAVHVLVDGDVEAELERRALATGVHGRRDRGAQAVLRYVAELAERAEVPTETIALRGEPAHCILEQSEAWPADLIVLGGAGRGRMGEPYVGPAVRQVLEFADVPVMVVPPRP